MVFTGPLADLRRDASIHFGISNVTLRPIRYEDRPFTHVLHLAVCAGVSGAAIGECFVKTFKSRTINGDPDGLRKRLVQDFEATARIHSLMSSHDDLGAVPPVACYPNYLTIVTEAVHGPTLLEYLQGKAAWFPGAAVISDLKRRLSLVGKWLRVLQGSSEPGTTLSVDSLRSYIDIRLERQVREASGVFDQAARRRLLQRVDQIGQQISTHDLRGVSIHADMALGNILVAGSRIVVLDFEMASIGTRLHDLTRVFLQLELLAVKPHVRAYVTGTLQEALLAGFDTALHRDQPLFRLLMLLHRINNIGTLTLNPRPFPESIYNQIVVRRHLKAITAELEGQEHDLRARS